MASRRREFLQKAEDAERRAAEATDPYLRLSWEEIAKVWRGLAEKEAPD
jgi:hypothetical protein